MNLERREPVDGAQILALSGRLDLEGTEQVELQFSTSAGSSEASVVVDLSEVSFLASLGMRMFVSAAKALRGRGLSLVLMRPQEPVRAALDVAGLASILPIADDEAAALRLARGE